MPDAENTPPQPTRTEKQREASRLNGAKSRGPKPLQPNPGLQLRHELLAQSILLEDESRDSFLQTVHSLERMFRPRDSYEASLVEMMIVASWRHTRLIEMERAALRLQPVPIQSTTLEPAARAFLAYQIANRDNSLEILNRQATRLDRQYHHAVACLTEQRRERERLREKRLKERI